MYGGTVSEEDFAEVFRHYIDGEKLTRDQIERFKSFTRVKGKKIRDDVMARLDVLLEHPEVVPGTNRTVQIGAYRRSPRGTGGSAGDASVGGAAPEQHHACVVLRDAGVALAIGNSGCC